MIDLENDEPLPSDEKPADAIIRHPRRGFLALPIPEFPKVILEERNEPAGDVSPCWKNPSWASIRGHSCFGTRRPPKSPKV